MSSQSVGRSRASMYRRLLRYLTPHWWRLSGNVVASVIAASLDAFVYTLLMPFQNGIFKQDNIVSAKGWLGEAQRALITPFADPSDKLGSLKVVMIAIVVIVLIKNVFQWLAGQLGASLQEFVTRDLRDGVFRHMQRLPLGYFHRTKVWQSIAKILTDTQQTTHS